MSVMIKLRLPTNATEMETVQNLLGLKDLPLDHQFGVVCISPKNNLYVVRTDTMDDLERRRAMSQEIMDAYGDVRISTI